MEQSSARDRDSADFCGDRCAPFHEVDLGRLVICRGLDAAVFRAQSGRKSSCFLPGTNLFTGRPDLGGKRGMELPYRDAPPGSVGRAENGTAPGRVNKRDKYGIKRREMVEFGKDRADDWSSDRKAINFRHDHKGSILETPAKRSNVWI